MLLRGRHRSSSATLRCAQGQQAGDNVAALLRQDVEGRHRIGLHRSNITIMRLCKAIPDTCNPARRWGQGQSGLTGSPCLRLPVRCPGRAEPAAPPARRERCERRCPVSAALRKRHKAVSCALENADAQSSTKARMCTPVVNRHESRLEIYQGLTRERPQQEHRGNAVRRDACH